MVQINILTMPASKQEKEINEKVKAIALDRNKVIAKDFGMEPLDFDIELYVSPKQIAGKLDPNGETLGIFAGYLEPENKIMLAHPSSTNGLFTDLWKEVSVLIDYSLTKFYLCKKYYPKKENFKLYYKYLSEALALFESGKIQDTVANFEFKMFFPGKKLKKEQELFLSFYIMRKYSGIKFIFEHLDQIMQDLDIKKTIQKIYNRSLDLLIVAEKEKVLLEEKRLKQTFKPGSK